MQAGVQQSFHHWKGRFNRGDGEFHFGRHTELCHLTNAHNSDFRLYRAHGQPHWIRAELYEGAHVSPGEFLIYRNIQLTDLDCIGLPALIRRLHASIKEHNPGQHAPRIPTRYTTEGSFALPKNEWASESEASEDGMPIIIGERVDSE